LCFYLCCSNYVRMEDRLWIEDIVAALSFFTNLDYTLLVL